MNRIADFSNNLNDNERLRLLKAANPDLNDEQAEDYLHTLHERYEQKQRFKQRGFSNQLAERALDKQGWPRPWGWHTVFFYPDSNRLRTRYAVILLLIVSFVAWKWALND